MAQSFFEGPARAGPSGFPVATTGRRALLVLATLLAVGAAVAWVHAPILRAQAYCLDDALFVRENPLVTHPGWPSTARFFREVQHPSTVKGYYLPLSMTSLMVDYAIGHTTRDLFVFHRTALALHVLCTLLLAVLLLQLFGSLPAAALAALLFGLHPLTVEPVAWIGERKTLLATLFALASMSAYVAGVRGRGAALRWASVLLFLLALLSKPTVAPLPLLMVLLDVWPLRRYSARAWIEKWPYFLLAALSAVVTVVSHQSSAGIEPITGRHVALWPLRSGYLLAFYLGKIVRPTNLTPVYVPPTPFVAMNPIVAAMICAVLALTVILVVLRRRAPGALVGWAFFILALGPTLGLVQYSWVIASDKYVYFAAVGILLVVTAGLAALFRSRAVAPWIRAAALVAIAAVLVAEACGVRAAQQPWRTTMALSRHMERFAPNAPTVLNRLGATLGEQGHLDEAVDYLRRAVAAAPEYAEARFNLGLLLANEGRVDEALPELLAAQTRSPDDPEAACLIGVLLTRNGKPAEAEAQFRRAIQLKPDFLEPLNQLGGLLVVQHRPAEGAEVFRQAVALVPTSFELQFRLGSALVMSGKSAEAMGPLREAIRLKPTSPEPLNALAWLLATDPHPAVRDTAEALRLARRAAELTDHQEPRVLDTLAAAEAAAGHYDEALHTSASAIDLAYERHAEGFAAQIERRRALYRAHTPYTEDPTAQAPALP